MPADRATGSGPQVKALGLGLGHRVVQKIAGVHGGQFEQVSPPTGYHRCYRLVLKTASVGR